MKNCLYDESIIISFKYSVSTKHYTIEQITKKTKEKCNDKIYYLFEKLEELSKTKLVDFQNKPKSVGYEMIPLNQFKLKIDSNTMKELKLTNDSKIIVFRFGKQNYRMFMIQSKVCPALLYLIGYDWDYSAYDHS